MNVFAIRHKPTNRFMPVPVGKNGSGSSYWEPTEQADGQMPRLFPHKRSAKSALAQWLRGTHKPVMEWASDPPLGEFGFGARYQECVGTAVEPVPGRNADDMEIVTFTLTEVNV